MLAALCSAFAGSMNVIRAVEPTECCGEEKDAKETLPHRRKLLDPLLDTRTNPLMATLLRIYASLIAGRISLCCCPSLPCAQQRQQSAT